MPRWKERSKTKPKASSAMMKLMMAVMVLTFTRVRCADCCCVGFAQLCFFVVKKSAGVLLCFAKSARVACCRSFEEVTSLAVTVCAVVVDAKTLGTKALRSGAAVFDGSVSGVAGYRENAA